MKYQPNEDKSRGEMMVSTTVNIWNKHMRINKTE